jgi:DNA-binding CsgD family transcriptional regulator/pimeloyl-ACP methyl ester carboxylesterase
MSEPTPPVRFVKTTDGVSIAYMVWPGQGVPWLQPHTPGGTPIALQPKLGLHQSTKRFAADRPFVWFDWRGTGQSDRRLASCLDDLLLDLDAVTQAIGASVDVLAPNAACFPVCSYAAKHPEAWRSLTLTDPMVRMEGSPQGMITRPGWGSDFSGLILSMTRAFFPQLRPEEVDVVAYEWADTVPEAAHRTFRGIDKDIDLTDTLKRIEIPSLVFKAFPRSVAASVAALIPDCVLLERSFGRVGARVRNDWDEHIGTRFADPSRQPTAIDNPGLTPRECEILGLIARGERNAAIAAKLSVSDRTIERHVQNIYAKLNVHNRAEATRWAIEHGVG